MELYEGQELTLKDLADWFGIKVKTLWDKTKREKKLDTLWRYADYHIEYSGAKKQKIKKIIIDKVYVSVYQKNLERVETRLTEFLSSKDNLVTGAQIGKALKKDDNILGVLKENTLINYSTRTLCSFYGKLYQKDTGIKGYRYPVWCRYEASLDSYFMLDDNEWAIIDKICNEEGLLANQKLLTMCHAEFEDKEEFKASRAEDIFHGMSQSVGRDKYFRILSRAAEVLGFRPVMASKCVDTIWIPVKEIKEFEQQN